MFNRGNLHGYLALMAKDVTFQPQLGSSSHGPDGIRRFWDSMMEGPDLTTEVVEMRDPSRWLQGECVWWGIFLSEHDALQALGLSE